MRLSIIIPVYNVEKYVAECLDSVLNQGLDVNNHEIIVINDGSPDGSLEIVESYAEKHQQIKVISKENGGLSSARNCGIEHAVGKYIYFLDSDDFLLPNCLNTIVDTCENYDLEVLTFWSERFISLPSFDAATLIDQKNQASTKAPQLSEIVSGEDYVANLPYRNEAWWYVINRKFLDGLGIEFEEGRFLEDAAFTLGVFLKAKKMAHLHLDAHRYRETPGSILTNREPSHYNKLIRDMQNAALAFDPILKNLENKTSNPICIARIKAKQQSLVFFSMMRMLKSTMSIEEVKLRMNEMTAIEAFPLDSLLGKDYNGLTYQVMVRLFKTEPRFYFFFRIANPIFKLKNKILK
ncbi:glycosyltransferase family 2 protein [Gelidibacter maritimus]|uniref:Glycosyltransferase n=1 Tax=Gelidibacter maritimus TaxID=2761487 RepID=A0A7W2R509_9FLAO|nr:glycosyltransferase [Gelidibacter maritimus]MBA6153640.1 glycosyltransferase [Gelidibacter maritimus]